MIKTYEACLLADHAEPNWNTYFEQNMFVLKLVFMRPVRLLQSQFRAKPSNFAGSGTQTGALLLAEREQALAIVEIKRPRTELRAATAYRPPGVYAPSEELTGAITQTLHQQSELRLRWAQHQADFPVLRNSGADGVRCVVLAGTTPTNADQLRSFEVFRHACKDVEVITYSELLDKMRLLREELSAPACSTSSPNDEIPS